MLSSVNVVLYCIVVIMIGAIEYSEDGLLPWWRLIMWRNIYVHMKIQRQCQPNCLWGNYEEVRISIHYSLLQILCSLKG